MSTCFDIYTLPSGCSVIQTYPSQRHPQPPSGGGGGGHPWRDIHEDKYREYPRERILINDDDEVAVLIALGLL